jgi:glycosyltransferase involved in cell wall biosynthesis
MRTLYLCYFGLNEPLVQTQVVPYLRRLSRSGIDVSLLTFEPQMRHTWSREAIAGRRAELQAQGIRWYCLPYHKRPTLPATLYDVARGAWLSWRLVRRHRIDTLHARNHVACVMGAVAKRLCGSRLIFDIRGLMAEEYVDAGTWPEGGFLFRMTKAAERHLLAISDGFVVLTERSLEVLFPGCTDADSQGRPIEIIPCCVDGERFRASAGVSRNALRNELKLDGRRVVVYAGALGGWYLSDAMAEFLAIAREQDPATFAMIISQSPPERLLEPLRRFGVPDSAYMVRRVKPEEVPAYLRAADFAISFIKPCYSKLSSSPTKIAEYLAAGLPIVCTAGIGDTDAMIAGDRVGVLLHRFDRQAYREALESVEALRRDPGVADRCRASARSRFDLEEVGGARYLRLYRRLAEARQEEAAVASAAPAV